MSTEPNDKALLELLPWYLNDSLALAEREQVEALLARSAEARQSLEELRRLAQAVRTEEQALNAQQTAPLDMGWVRLQRSLQQQAKAPARRDWWKPSLAAAAALMVALQMGILMRPAETGSDWRLQSGAGSQQLSAGYRLQLRFVDQAEWQQVRGLLLELDGLLIDGPSVLGMVQVHVPSSQRFADGAALVSWLQQQPVVEHAALLDSVGP